MDRDEIKAFRPMVSVMNSDETSELECFQNETLRPVIKLQHDLLIRLFSTNPLVKNISASKGSRIEFQKKVKDLITGQPTMKNQLIGMVSGMLTTSEIEFYLSHQTELNKRIHGMICQRIADTLY
jgi:hypothetical protein